MNTEPVARRRPRVGCDVDGVIAHFAQTMLEHVNEWFGTSDTLDDVPDWDVGKLIPEVHRKDFWVYFFKKARAHEMPILGGAQAGIEALRAHADIFFVTAHPETARSWVHDRGLWLRKSFGAKHEHCVYTHAKYLVAVDTLIDDRPDNAEAWATEWPERTALLWDTPFNRAHQPTRQNVRRVCSWNEVIEHVRGL